MLIRACRPQRPRVNAAVAVVHPLSPMGELSGPSGTRTRAGSAALSQVMTRRETVARPWLSIVYARAGKGSCPSPVTPWYGRDTQTVP